MNTQTNNHNNLIDLSEQLLPQRTSGSDHLSEVLNQTFLVNPTNYRTFGELSVTPQEFTLALASSSSHRLATNPTSTISVALSDFDGTLIKDSSGGFFIEYGAKNQFYHPTIRPSLNDMLAQFSLQPSALETREAISTDILRVKHAFEVWLQDSTVHSAERESITRSFYAMCTWILAGHSPEEIRSFARDVIRDTGYGTNYFSGAKELIDTFRTIGVEPMIVSATAQEIVEIGAEYFDIPTRRIHGTQLQLGENGTYTTEISPPLTFREGKVTAAKILIQRYLEETGDLRSVDSIVPLFALGDSPSKTDQQLLDYSDISLVVEPQTPKDAEFARDRILAGSRSLFIDFETTIAGAPANKFQRHLDQQQQPQERYL